MTQNTAAFAPAEIEAVAAALARSAAGRTLLDGLADTRRRDDLRRIFRAIERLEHHASEIWTARQSATGETMSETLKTIARVIESTRRDVATLKKQVAHLGGPRPQSAELSELAGTSERSVATLLEAARRLRIIVMGLREADIDGRLCTLIDQQVTHTLIAAEQNEFTAGQLHKMTGLLGHLESTVTRLAQTAPSEAGARRHSA